jgi:hypothetical protein
MILWSSHYYDNSCHHHPFILMILWSYSTSWSFRCYNATITFLILMILWAIHYCSFLIVANHYLPSPFWSYSPIWCHGFLVVIINRFPPLPSWSWLWSYLLSWFLVVTISKFLPLPSWSWWSYDPIWCHSLLLVIVCQFSSLTSSLYDLVVLIIVMVFPLL